MFVDPIAVPEIFIMLSVCAINALMWKMTMGDASVDALLPGPCMVFLG